MFSSCSFFILNKSGRTPLSIYRPPDVWLICKIVQIACDRNMTRMTLGYSSWEMVFFLRASEFPNWSLSCKFSISFRCFVILPHQWSIMKIHFVLPIANYSSVTLFSVFVSSKFLACPTIPRTKLTSSANCWFIYTNAFSYSTKLKWWHSLLSIFTIPFHTISLLCHFTFCSLNKMRKWSIWVYFEAQEKASPVKNFQHFFHSCQVIWLASIVIASPKDKKISVFQWQFPTRHLSFRDKYPIIDKFVLFSYKWINFLDKISQKTLCLHTINLA